MHFVLTGNVQSAGAQVRINAQLFDGSAGAQLWNKTFNGELTDLFAPQDRVTAVVGNSLGREMVIVAARASHTVKSSAGAANLKFMARALDLKPQSTDTYRQMEALQRQLLQRETQQSERDARSGQVVRGISPGRLLLTKNEGCSRKAIL